MKRKEIHLNKDPQGNYCLEIKDVTGSKFYTFLINKKNGEVGVITTSEKPCTLTQIKIKDADTYKNNKTINAESNEYPYTSLDEIIFLIFEVHLMKILGELIGYMTYPGHEDNPGREYIRAVLTPRHIIKIGSDNDLLIIKKMSRAALSTHAIYTPLNFVPLQRLEKNEAISRKILFKVSQEISKISIFNF